jgi:hypothetical protein
VSLQDAVHAGDTGRASCWRTARMPSAQTQHPRNGALPASFHRAQCTGTLWRLPEHWRSEVVPAWAGSGDKEASAKLCRLEIDEVAVAFGPPTSCEVITEAAHCPLLGVRPDSGPH